MLAPSHRMLQSTAAFSSPNDPTGRTTPELVVSGRKDDAL